jgi:2-succinyl-5-enolpyruvyl-6-hydroxy-3-cyclohexene-1-carboxylate synthase
MNNQIELTPSKSDEFFTSAHHSNPNINNHLAQNVLEAAIKKGVKEFCLAAASRNASLVYALANTPEIKTYYWSEERSAAFFALGRSIATGLPVAIVTTSGTAAAEAFPAIMTAHYWGIPLLLITADRPRRYRGSGAPQSCEQVGLYGTYVQHEQDLALNEICCLEKWAGTAPAHVNVCLEEPSDAEAKLSRIEQTIQGPFSPQRPPLSEQTKKSYQQFIESVNYPLVVVGNLGKEDRKEAIKFLLKLGAPVYTEGFSGLREERELDPIRITSIDKVWNRSKQSHYPIDGILRIGSIPTGRLWRDLEDKEDKIQVFSVSELPFTGLSWGDIHHCNLHEFFKWAPSRQNRYEFSSWQEAEASFQKQLQQLYKDEPRAEASMVHQLSNILPLSSHLFLGNSLPVREWDSAATFESRHYDVNAVRGVNGIDGQISTFLGTCKENQENWALIGDLTALYDMAAPWILEQMPNVDANIIIINNSGGQIFAPMYSHPAFLNRHELNFEPLARMWNWRYEKWTSVPEKISPSKGGRMIELIPDNLATERFHQKIKQR